MNNQRIHTTGQPGFIPAARRLTRSALLGKAQAAMLALTDLIADLEAPDHGATGVPARPTTAPTPEMKRNFGGRTIEKTVAHSGCPECGAGMVERKSRYGVFLGCTNYPACKGTLKAGRAPTRGAMTLEQSVTRCP